MRTKHFLILSILLFSGLASYSQSISGRVSGLDENGKPESLPGANIHWLGTSIGTSANADGSFVLNNPATVPSRLVVSFIGFMNDTITVNSFNQSGIQITLKNTVTLKEVEVVVREATTMNKLFTPVNTEVIGKKELMKAACCNLSESFSTNASVDVAIADAVSGARKIQMLGLDGIYTQMLFENMPALRGLSASYGINYVPGTWIENILITKGTGSVVNGYESISGQINLEFLKPQNQKNRFFVNLYANQKSRTEANLHYAKKVNDKWSSLLFTHVSDQSMKQDNNKDSFLDMPLVRQYNVFNRWDFHNQKNFEAQFGIRALAESRVGGQKTFNYSTDFGKATSYGIAINTLSAEYFTKTGFMFPSQPLKSLGIQTSGKIQQQDMFFGDRKYTGEQKNFYGNLIYQDVFKNTNHKYKVGMSYLLDDYNEAFNDSAFARTESVPGMFAEYTYSFLDLFSLVAGLRSDQHNLYGNFYTPRLHIRYFTGKSTTLRLSAGRGFRTSNVFVQNQSVFASSRQVVVAETFRPEIAWNYGVSANQQFKLFGNEAFVNFDFFRTDFENQVVVDLEHANKVLFYNLSGLSYSNSLQTDFGCEPFENFALKAAYKWYEVRSTYGGKLLDKPYVPKHRVMLNMAYSTFMEVWKFDLTVNWLGQSRLPNTTMSPIEYQRPEHSKSYYQVQTQISKKFKKFDTYLGVENLLNYVQKNPIIAAYNPYGQNFDASIIYAPIEGRIIYFGIRIEIK